MPRVYSSCPSQALIKRHSFSTGILAVLCCLLLAPSANAQITLLIPNQPSVEAPAHMLKDAPGKKDEKRPAEQKTAPAKTEPAAESNAKPQEQPAAAAPQPAKNAETPSQPDAAKPEDSKAATGKADAADTASSGPEQPQINEEVDVLIAMMRPFQYDGLGMDMPQLFAVLRYDAATPVKEGVAQPERRDLLGDVEEIRYLNQKAWGANVALTKPGLYQFITEGRPWWDAAHGRFLQQYVKTTLPVYGVERGWSLPVGQRFEIVPLSRPFGLTAPAMFSGVVFMDGKPLATASVRMARINTEKKTVPTPWHEDMAARTNSKGEFSFVLNQPGWWCCMASAPGDPLKGPDGQPKPLQLGALFWLYVDGPASDPRKR